VIAMPPILECDTGHTRRPPEALTWKDKHEGTIQEEFLTAK